jgi:hypothetical protein
MVPLGIVSFVIYAIMRGNLVPKATVEAIVKGKDAQISELGQVIDIWRNAALLKDEAFKEMSPILQQLVDNDEVVLKLLRAIKQIGETPPVVGGGTR